MRESSAARIEEYWSTRCHFHQLRVPASAIALLSAWVEEERVLVSEIA